MQQADSTLHTGMPAGEQPQFQPRKALSVREVLSRLPASATPQQQDSALRAVFKPKVEHWSNRPDTLHLPGTPVGKSFREVGLPQYYRESFFARDSLFHPELPGGRLGVAGDPKPYSIAGDNILTSVLLFCFVVGMTSVSLSRDFLLRQVKTFFRKSRQRSFGMGETGGELRFRLFLIVQTCLLSSIVIFFYAENRLGSTFIIDQYRVMGIYTAVLAAYYLLKAIVYTGVNAVFFDRHAGSAWLHTYLLLTALQGIAFFPVVLLRSYFHLPLETLVWTIVGIVIFVKLLLFYKAYLIFFSTKGGFLQNILYFCALEVMPLVALWGALLNISYYLKINY